MLVKAALLFLALMAVIAWAGGLIGRLRPPRDRRDDPRRLAAPCEGCGRPRVGPGPCACGRE